MINGTTDQATHTQTDTDNNRKTDDYTKRKNELCNHMTHMMMNGEKNEKKKTNGEQPNDNDKASKQRWKRTVFCSYILCEITGVIFICAKNN